MDIDALRHRLQNAPFEFLSSVSSFSLPTFDKAWHLVCEDVAKASQLSLLNDEDNSLVHATAALLATWGDLLLKTEDEAASRTIVFMDEIQDVFAQITISDVDRHNSSSPPPTFSRGPRSLSGAAPSYIPAAYSWILQNVHDPYPSSQTKDRISRDAGRPLRVITDWFKEVRRYIGWVAICKGSFCGSRARAVQAAKHAYLRHDSTSQIPLSPDIVSQFEAIRMRLRNLYPLADDHGDLSDSTDDSFLSPPLSFRRSPSLPYDRTRSSSATPSLVFSSDDEDNRSLDSFTSDDASAVRLGKRKKFNEEDGSRQLKRNRSGFISIADGLVGAPVTTTLNLSPSSSHIQPMSSRKRCPSVAATEREDVTPLSSTSTPCDARPPLRVPKRRLSVSDSQPISKRPCLPPTVGPRKQAVSTPIPVAHQTTPDIDDWFRTFELPDTSLSVELFSNWDATVESNVFPYDSLCDGSLQSDSPNPLNVTPLSLPTPLNLGVSLGVDPSVLDISSAFTEPPPTQLTALSTPPSPITATTTPVFDFLDAFLSAVNAESAEPHSTQFSSSSSSELSLSDTIDLFGESVVMP